MQMSTAHFRTAAISGVLFPFLFLANVHAEALAPYKDDLFSGQNVLETSDGGDFTRIDYDEMRDINGRDSIPERRVKDLYVSLKVRRAQENQTLPLAAGPLDVARVGKDGGQAFTVIFIHGRGGDRRLGMNDITFGGNFNRLKNLAANNGGTYYAPSVHSFDETGVAEIAGLIDHASAQSGGRPVVLACASMGSFICWGMSRDAKAVSHLSGMAILGGAPDPELPKSAAAKAKLPIWFTHGSRDSVYAADDQIAIYRTLRKAGQPVRFTLYETGSHGTPVRMSDWRTILNWLLQ
ncbi:alpha/beta hydrolase [Rhizobium glycinendophyticum]|uniref:Alpha/beta hydrolase n=2 Tax=Rhizobium glycinendophyticum TaxID=2589807 RepID=A0A504UBQ4_9HYPH|nr:dienelactone hydrolase family protein [Rhizobium glycinendophyticum]TPP11047.1 alpha/beta hydrolase [Rhizobium glycinendophyticum]